MIKHLLLASAMLSTIAIPSASSAQGRIKCVDTPAGTEGDPDPDTYCPTDYGTDPSNLGARTSDDAIDLAALVAEHDAKAPAQPR